MKITKSKLISSLILIYIGFYCFLPLTKEQGLNRAKDELKYYCHDYHFNCERYKFDGLKSDFEGLMIFEWRDFKDTNLIIQVRVPNQRIGDLTFGFLGKDVSLGSYNKKNKNSIKGSENLKS